MRKKILFIQPTIYDDFGRLIKKDRLYFVGLAYPLLAAMTPPEWEVEICLETIEEVPFDTDAGVIALGGMGHAAKRGRDLAAEFRRREKIVIMGGPMASLAPELLQDACDAVVVGDAEEVWPQLLADLEANTLQPIYQQALTTLRTPTPRYELILHKRIGDFLPVQAGRGCPHSCAFCSIYCLYRTRYFRRDIAEVIRDIRRVQSLGFRKFLLLDDNIVADPDYMLDLCREIKKLDMRWMSQCALEIAGNADLLRAAAESGCTTLSFGLESITPASLARLNKSWCKPEDYLVQIDAIVDAGIEVATEMIVGVEDDTPDSLRATVDFILRSRIIAPKFYLLTPIPGTDLFRQYRAEGRLAEQDVLTYTPSRAVITHPHMTTQELNAIFWEMYQRTYALPHVLQRTVGHRRVWRDPQRYFFFLGLNLFYRWQIQQRIAPIIM